MPREGSRAEIAAVRKELRLGGSTKRDLGRDGGACESGDGFGGRQTKCLFRLSVAHPNPKNLNAT